MALEIVVNTGWGNGLLPDGTKSLPEAMLTYQQWDTLPFILGKCLFEYRQISNIRRTKSQNLEDSHGVLWLYLPNSLKPDVKSRMKM